MALVIVIDHPETMARPCFPGIQGAVNIYLDTILWNTLCDQDIEPGLLIESFAAKNANLVLSHQTVFELAKTFTRTPERGKKLFSYVKQFVQANAPCTREISGVLEAEMRLLQCDA